MSYELRILNYELWIKFIHCQNNEISIGYGYGDNLPALLRKALQAGARYVMRLRQRVIDYKTTSLLHAFSHFHIPHLHIHALTRLRFRCSYRYRHTVWCC
jgi:hypothetical protein